MRKFVRVVFQRAALASVLGLATWTGTALGTEIRLLSMNMHGAGADDGKSIDETIAVFKAVNADIIAAIETVAEPDPCNPGTTNCLAPDLSRAADLAKAMGYNFHEFKHNTETHWADAVLTKYEIGKETPNGTGVELNVDGKKVVVYAMNLNDAPYVPYQLLNIEYGKYSFIKTEAEAIAMAKQAHGKALELLLADVASEQDATAQFVMGDFNEPSHLDWTEQAVAAKLQPIVVHWPFTTGFEATGFLDSFRSQFPDVVAKPGFTWTTTTEPTDTSDHHDRIDFILTKGVTIKSAAIVGEKVPQADLVITPWPSDHRASMAVVDLK
jgi:exodeoxyribonuclease III